LIDRYQHQLISSSSKSQSQDDEGGLEVQRRADGAWVPAPSRRAELSSSSSEQGWALLCNVGDLLQRWTGDVLRSTPHRVVGGLYAECAGEKGLSHPFQNTNQTHR
jgi:hypothetical protein